jgi:type IV pilus assembly protein PilB
MQTLREELLQILIKSKRLTQEQLDGALKLQKQKDVPLRKILIENNLISEAELLPLLSKQLYIPTLHLSKYRFDPAVINLVSQHIARRYCVIPISRMGSTLTVAMSDPLNIFALDDLRILTGCNIDTVLCSEEEIIKAIDAYYQGQQEEMEGILSQEWTAPVSEQVEILKQDTIELSEAIKESQAAPIVKLVDLMLAQALKKRASDIHVEPVQEGLRIRYRIDGSLHDMFRLPKINQNAVLARIKIISDLDITEARKPQDGRFRVKLEKKEVDFRVSALPTTFGQKFVLRALDKSNLSIGLDKLGFSEQPLRIFKESIERPFGMILVTGPTGSGKSTTLYSILNQLNVVERNIITVEDPVEYEIDGITQIQVKPDIGLDFAFGLRALLRQNPDIIMIGEIRDSETADIAVKASLTGQLVLSTLHTNDATSSITRIIDMGVEPFLVASSLIMACAQRLCRCICPRCKEKIDIPQDFLKNIGFHDKATFYRGKGCSYCANTGVYGRIAILEALPINDTLREMIMQNKSSDEIREYAVKNLNMKFLREDAFLKVKEGTITLEEAIRVTTEE